MPLNIDFTQVLLHMLNFVILAGALGFLLFKPITKFMADRQKHFEDLAKENEEAAKTNADMKAEYEQKLEEAKAEIADMHRNAEKEAAETAKEYIDSAHQKANAIIAAAETEAGEQFHRHRHQLRQQLDSAQTEISELVLSATQKLLSDTVTPERNSALYDEFIRRTGKTVADERKSR